MKEKLSSILKKFSGNRAAVIATRVALCLLTLLLLVSFTAGELGFPATEYRQYEYLNGFLWESAAPAELTAAITQGFIAEGNTISRVRLYINEVTLPSAVLHASLLNSSGEVLIEKELAASILSPGTWNDINLYFDALTPGEEYTLKFDTLNNTGGIVTVLNTGERYEKVTLCSLGGRAISDTLAIGTYQLLVSTSAVHSLGYAIDIIFVLAVFFAIAYVIIFMGRCRRCLLKNKASVRLYFNALSLSLICLFLYNPLSLSETEAEYTGSFGLGTANNVDISKIISGFTLWLLLLGLFFIVFLLLSAELYERREKSPAAYSFYEAFIFVCLANSIIRFTTFFLDGYSGKSFYYSSYITGLVLIAAVVFILSDLECHIPFNKLFSLMLLALAIAYPIAALIKQRWEGGLLLLEVQALLLAVLMLAVRFIPPLLRFIREDSLVLPSLVLSMSLMPLLLSVFLEAVNIRAGLGKPVASPALSYLATLFAPIALFAVLLALNKYLKPIIARSCGIAMPIMLLGISALSVQLPLIIELTPDIFESANYSVLITDFLNYGKIPIVDHYGGHMMSGVWEGILYGILNNDTVGAGFSPYSVYLTPVLVLCCYLLLKNFLGREAAFFACLILPLVPFVSYFGLGFLIIAATVSFIKRPSYLNATLIWLACIWCSLYRLDLGFAFDIASVLALAALIIAERKFKYIKPLLITLASAIASFLVLFSALCICSGVNPVSRVLEFLSISSSNQNWAYGYLGDTNTLAFSICYIFIPLAVEISLVYALFSKRLRKGAGTAHWVILISLGFSYFANFSRGLVRHSLVEGFGYTIVWTAFIYFAVFISAFIDKRWVIPLFFAVLIVFMPYFGTAPITEGSVLDNSVEAVDTLLDDWYFGGGNGACEGERIYRVSPPEDFMEYAGELGEITDTLLTEDETFIDFMNVSFLYSYLERECPVYVSQTPLQLADEYSMECYINELKAANVPIAILPYNNSVSIQWQLDGIFNSYRYYLVAEYLYQNYLPLCMNGGFAVWCRAESYPELYARAAGKFKIIDYGYDRNYITDSTGTPTINSQNSIHVQGLLQLPYIMGEASEHIISEGAEIYTPERQGNLYIIDKEIPRENGNLLSLRIDYSGADGAGLTGDLDESTEICARVGRYEGGVFYELAVYYFRINEGSHEYLIRISTDYSWYGEGSNAIVIEPAPFVENIAASIVCNEP